MQVRISELSAELLDSLPAVSTAGEAVLLADLTVHRKPSELDQIVDVYHRKLMYTVGKWYGWEGKYWVVEERTGIIFRCESVKALQATIRLCSASFHEPDAVRA